MFALLLFGITVQEVLGAAVGTFLIGPFIPSILRKVKAFFVKESTALKADVKSAEATVAKKL